MIYGEQMYILIWCSIEMSFVRMLKKLVYLFKLLLTDIQDWS